MKSLSLLLILLCGCTHINLIDPPTGITIDPIKAMTKLASLTINHTNRGFEIPVPGSTNCVYVVLTNRIVWVTNGPVCNWPKTNYLSFIYPTNATNYWWVLQSSDDLQNWQTVSGYFKYQFLTNQWLDEPPTNQHQYWRMSGTKS